LRVDWGDGNSENVTGNTVTHNYSETGIFEVILKNLTNFPDNFNNNQKNVITIKSKPPMMQVAGIGFAAFNGCSGIAEFNIDLSMITSTPDGDMYSPAQAIAGAFQSAFFSGANITLTFPNKNFTRIGNYTFLGAKLKSLTFSTESSIEVGKAAIHAWGAATATLTTLSFGKIIKLEDDAFREQTQISSFTADFSLLTRVGIRAFYQAIKVDTYLIGNFTNPNINSIGQQAFLQCGFKEIYFPNSSTVDMSENSGFYGCFADTIRLGKVTKLGGNDFYGCERLANFTSDFSLLTEIPDGDNYNYGQGVFVGSFVPGTVLDFRESGLKATQLNKIGSVAFRASHIKAVYFEKNITISLYDGTFGDCHELEEIHFGKILFKNSANTNICRAFFNCNNLKIFDADLSENEDFPDGTFITAQDYRGLFTGAFAQGTVLDFTASGANAININKIGVAVFSATHMKKLSFSPTQTFSIETAAFLLSEIEELNLGIVTKIDTYAFQNCDKLRIIRIYSTTPPPMYTEIGHSDASGLHLALESIFVPDESVSAYKRADGWSNYAQFIKGFSQDI